ncbi:MAG TPA: hypothetical protein VGX91_10450 [Candidatus Cybelea sp.]|nr:hypothetical protein [Candidatus Cybelea sp.]
MDRKMDESNDERDMEKTAIDDSQLDGVRGGSNSAWGTAEPPSGGSGGTAPGP